MKALLLQATPLRFAIIQTLRPLSARFCYSGPFASVKLAEIPEPGLPTQEWVKIKTSLCGFCGSDLNLMLMKDSPTAMPFTSFPCVPGHELCGHIIEVGRAVKGWKAGDFVAISPQLNCDTRQISPVCPSCRAGKTANCENFAEGSLAPGMFTGICSGINGGFAPYIVAHKSQLYKVPSKVSPESAVLTEPLAVALQAVMDNPPDNDDKVLVIGGGVIGALTVKAIRGLGIKCHITVAEPSSFAAEYVLANGADKAIPGGIIDAAVEITGAKTYKPMLVERVVMGGFQKVYDTVGHRKTLFEAMRVLSTGGTLSVLGIGKDVRLDFTPLWLKLQTIKGCYAHGFNKTRLGMRHTFEIALDMMAKKKIVVEDMLTHTFPLDDYRKMIEVNMGKGKHGAIKTAVRFD